MELASMSLTVLFEDPFWVGLWERRDAEGYSVCRTVFGAEPRDFEVYQLVLSRWNRLKFSLPLESDRPDRKRRSPKRMRRQAKQAVQAAGTGTKAQQALKLQQEQDRQARQTQTRAQREAEADRRFAMRQEKRREKHRGH